MPTNVHFTVKVLSRGGGKSAVASAAYQSGEKLSVLESAAYRSGAKLHDAQRRLTFDYTHKEDVQHTEILAPANAPVWVDDRQLLWTRVEAAERRKDAQLARDIIAALPRELTPEQHIALVREFVQGNFVQNGMVADTAIHNKESSDGKENPHVHILLTTREIGPGGFGKKNRDWNQRDLVGRWRDSWEEISNRYLEESGSDYRISTHSYASQGIDKTPTEHMGPKAANMEEKGKETTKGDRNRQVKQHNVEREIAQSFMNAVADTNDSQPGADQSGERPDDRHVWQLATLESTEGTGSTGQPATATSSEWHSLHALTVDAMQDDAWERQQQFHQHYARTALGRAAHIAVELVQRLRDYAQRLGDMLKEHLETWLPEGVGTSLLERFHALSEAAQRERDREQGKGRDLGYER